jgi:hypothetical protein
MTKRTLQNRYADADFRRVVEAPRDELEQEYARGEDKQQAKAIWEKFGKNENHRRRVITLLAREVLRTASPSDQDAAAEATIHG